MTSTTETELALRALTVTLGHVEPCQPLIVNDVCVGGCSCFRDREALIVRAAAEAIEASARYARKRGLVAYYGERAVMAATRRFKAALARRSVSVPVSLTPMNDDEAR